MLESHDLQRPPPIDLLSEQGPVALFLDFDGTLIELAERPTSISVPDRLGERLEALSTRLGGRIALISGRAVDDLELYLGKLQVARAGSHGLEQVLANGASLREVRDPLTEEARASLETFATARGFLLERKPHGAALHYRGAPHLEMEGMDFAEPLARLHGLQIKRGSCVIELVSRDADKGAAVYAFMDVEPFTGSRPVFVGDDLTDEDGFRAATAMGGFGIIVGDRQPTTARYRLANTSAVHRWLQL